MAVIFKGFKVPGTDMCALEDALNIIKDKVTLKAKRIYAQLLAKEIEMYVDDIALNLLPRPTDAPIYDKCVNELNNKIGWATANNAPTIYNFGVQSAVFVYNNDTYIRLDVSNEKLASEIKVPELESFDFNQKESASAQQNAKIWDEISKIYNENNSFMHRKLTPEPFFDIEWTVVAQYFAKPEERLDTRVRYTLTSELLNLIGMKKEIPNVRLLHYLDEAMLMLEQPLIQKEAAVRKARASSLFINITEEIVKKDPREEAPSTLS